MKGKRTRQWIDFNLHELDWGFSFKFGLFFNRENLDLKIFGIFISFCTVLEYYKICPNFVQRSD